MEMWQHFTKFPKLGVTMHAHILKTFKSYEKFTKGASIPGPFAIRCNVPQVYPQKTLK